MSENEPIFMITTTTHQQNYGTEREESDTFLDDGDLPFRQIHSGNDVYYKQNGAEDSDDNGDEGNDVNDGDVVQYKKASPIASFVNIVKTFAGAGTFGLPWALKQAGVLTGVISILVMALLANYTMKLLVRCRRFVQAQEEYNDTSDYWKIRVLRQKVPVTDPDEIAELQAQEERERRELEDDDDDEEDASNSKKAKQYFREPVRKKPIHMRTKFDGVPDSDMDARRINEHIEGKGDDPNDYIYDRYRVLTYTDLGYEALGRWGRVLVYILMFLCNLGVCTVYLTMISEIMHSMVPVIPQRVWILFTIPLFVPLSWIRSYAFMTPVSILGTLSLLTALGAVLGYGFVSRVHEMKWPWQYGKYSWINIDTLPNLLGVVLFLFNTHTMVLPIEQSTQPRKRYTLSLNMGFTFIVLVNLTFAILVFLFFGSDIADDATKNLPTGSFWVYIIKGCLVAELIFTFAVVLMPVAEVLDENMLYKLKHNRWTFLLTGSVVRTILVLIVVGVAEIFGNNFGLVMGLIGGIGPNLLGFGLPSLFYIILMRRHIGFVSFMGNCFIICFGAFALVWNTYTTYVEIRKEWD